MSDNRNDLTDEEKKISDYLQTAKPLKDKKLKTKLEEAAKQFNTKSERITLRLLPSDLEQIKLKAAKTGIPYQTLISSLIHQYATDQIDLNT